MITQILENVEKQLRGLVSETYSVRNYLRRRIGPFKARPVFKARLFYGIPSEGAQKRPFDVITFHLEPEKVGACYKTTGALGIHSSPEKIQNKGLPWWTLYATGAALVTMIGGSFVLLPYLGASAARKVVGVGPGADASAHIGAAAGGAPRPAAPSPAPARPAPARRQPGTSYLATEDGATVVRYSVVGDVVRVEMSDGTVLHQNSPRLQGVGEGWVMLDGERILWRPRSADTVGAAAPVAQSEGAGVAQRVP